MLSDSFFKAVTLDSDMREFKVGRVKQTFVSVFPFLVDDHMMIDEAEFALPKARKCTSPVDYSAVCRIVVECIARQLKTTRSRVTNSYLPKCKR